MSCSSLHSTEALFPEQMKTISWVLKRNKKKNENKDIGLLYKDCIFGQEKKKVLLHHWNSWALVNNNSTLRWHYTRSTQPIPILISQSFKVRGVGLKQQCSAMSPMQLKRILQRRTSWFLCWRVTFTTPLPLYNCSEIKTIKKRFSIEFPRMEGESRAERKARGRGHWGTVWQFGGSQNQWGVSWCFNACAMLRPTDGHGHTHTHGSTILWWAFLPMMHCHMLWQYGPLVSSCSVCGLDDSPACIPGGMH